jgi:hypothetical protein
MTRPDAAQFAAYYEPQTAERFFAHCWRTMTELFPAFIEVRFEPTWSIMEIPVEEQRPEALAALAFLSM